MAILSKEINQVQVRIRRYPQETYFDEYAKVGDREKPDATSCDRYIIPEPGQMYTIEVTLKKGYKFGNSNSIKASLYLPNNSDAISAMRIYPPNGYRKFTKGDTTVHLNFATNVRIRGVNTSGARLAFHRLEIDEDMQNETNVMGIDPIDLGNLRIEVIREKYDLVRKTPREEAEGFDELRQRVLAVDKNEHLWDAKKVDQENFKKHGITTAIGFVGGHQTQAAARKNWMAGYTHGNPLNFQYYCRPAAFLEHVNIVPYPPPLYSFSWEKLDEDERRLALQELQEIDKKRTTQWGRIEIDPDEWPEEWDSWNTMQPFERRNAFKKLQKDEKAYRRVQVQNQIAENPADRIQDLERDGLSNVSGTTNHRSRGVTTIDLTGSPQRKSNLRKRPTHVQQEPIELDRQSRASTATLQGDAQVKGIKQEPIDVDRLQTPSNSTWPATTIKRNIEDDTPRIVKRVKFEDDDLVDMSQHKYFPLGDQATVNKEMMMDRCSNISREGEIIDLDADELVPTEEDERSEEEKRAEEEQRAIDEAELARATSDTEKRMAAYMELLRSQM